MKTSFTTIFVLGGLIASSVATPATRLRRQATNVCASGTPNCCDVDVLGVADLDCSVPSPVPTDVPNFQAICAASGKIDMCCTLDLLSQGLLCSKPV